MAAATLGFSARTGEHILVNRITSRILQLSSFSVAIINGINYDRETGTEFVRNGGGFVFALGSRHRPFRIRRSFRSIFLGTFFNTMLV